MVIYYFSATGNSLKMAMDIASKKKDVEIRKIGMNSVNKYSESKEVGFIFPVYMGAIPDIVREFLHNFTFKKGTYYFSICTYYLYKGNTLSSVSKILKDKGVLLNYGAYLSTIGNCLMEYEVSVNKRIKKLRQAEIDSTIIVNDILRKISNNPSGYCRTIEKFHKSLFKIVFASTYKKFTLENTCTGCGRCEKICPANNINISSGKAQWGENCIACHACIHWCPENAINIGKSKGRLQYHNPAVNISMLLKPDISSQRE